MHRINNRQHIESINKALELIPENIREMVKDVDILSEINPRFVGLHFFKDASNGRLYKDTPHVIYPYHQTHRPRSERKTTIFIPKRSIQIKTLIHEFGHVLDEQLLFTHNSKPVTWYGETDRFESFAESFTAWIFPDQEYNIARDKLFKENKKTVALFEKLSQ